jgi:hypothetical protein
MMAASIQSPHLSGDLSKEADMTKAVKVRVIRFGDAKRLTRGDVGFGAELGSLRKEIG